MSHFRPSIPPSVPTAADDVGLQEIWIVGGALRCFRLLTGSQQQGQVPGIVLSAQRGVQLGFGSGSLLYDAEK